jgi:hypothetical protein
MGSGGCKECGQRKNNTPLIAVSAAFVVVCCVGLVIGVCYLKKQKRLCSCHFGRAARTMMNRNQEGVMQIQDAKTQPIASGGVHQDGVVSGNREAATPRDIPIEKIQSG